MYVCICKAVTEKHIHVAAAQGVKTLKELRNTLGVGADCGRCSGCANQCLKQAHHSKKNTKPDLLLAA
jgi:bacterioferritin-associated ferredoxin